MRSLYHEYYDEEQGEEQKATFFMYRNLEKPYHIDYIFAPVSLIPKGFSLLVGNASDWLDLSDHMPIFVDF